MYSRYRLAQKYFHYYFTAANGRGHGIHSPFVFDFIVHVLNDGSAYPDYLLVEGLRRKLLGDRTVLEVEDRGAGSAWKGSLGRSDGGVAGDGDGGEGGDVSRRRRSVGEIARRAAKPRKLGQLLYRIARYYGVRNVLELGTSLGISTAYLAAGVRDVNRGTGVKGEELVGERDEGAGGHGEEAGEGGERFGGVRGSGARVWSIEGSGEVAAVAERNLNLLGLEVKVVRGDFDDLLPGVLREMERVDLAFVDGNHRKAPTLAYFEQLMGYVGRPGILIFDDIHWSMEMEEAWAGIKDDPRVYLTVDLFFIGIVFLREEFKVKQDFVIRF